MLLFVSEMSTTGILTLRFTGEIKKTQTGDVKKYEILSKHRKLTSYLNSNDLTTLKKLGISFQIVKSRNDYARLLRRQRAS